MKRNKIFQTVICFLIIISILVPSTVMAATTTKAPTWCWEGGSKHVIPVGIGWYNSYDEAWNAALKYDGTHQEVQECDCGKFTAYVRSATSENTLPKTIKLTKTTYVYDGKSKKPSVIVKDNKGNKVSSSNYTVTYPNGRKNVGKYAVTIKFKGNYSGSVKKIFTIKPKSTNISKLTAGKKKFTVKRKKQSTQTTGYQIQYATNSKFTKNKKTVTVSKNKTTTKTISKLKAKKKYYVRIRTYKIINGKKIYSSWSETKSVKTK